MEYQNYTHIAKLDSGDMVGYDMMVDAESSFVPNPKIYTLLGEGSVFEVRGVGQTHKHKARFYKRAKIAEDVIH